MVKRWTDLMRRTRKPPAVAPETAGLLALPSPFRDEAGTVYVVEAPDAPPADLADRLRDGDYGRPFLLEQEGVRCLHFGMGFTQSAVRLAEPDVLHLTYTQAMAGFLIFHPRPRNLLLLGLGGGGLARFCRRHLPAARLTAVEIDPDVLAFRAACLVPPDDGLFSVVRADGARYVTESRAKHDVILVDAFDRHGVAPSMCTDDFFADAHARLAGRGLLVMNVAGDRAGQTALLARLAGAFGGRMLTLHLKAQGNRIAFAFRDPEFSPRWPWLKSAARDAGGRVGVDLHAFATQLERENS